MSLANFARLLGAIAIATILATNSAHARSGPVTRVNYSDGETTLVGAVARPMTRDVIKRPAVLIVPEWWGVNDYATSRAAQLADLGYVAFVADIYGAGRVTTDPAVAGKWAGEFRGAKDRTLLRRRAAAALSQLRTRPDVDASRIAAIGYCFGGTTVLEMARDGQDIKGVVSFHGSLDTPTPATKGSVSAEVLVLHGADDPMVKKEDVEAVKKEFPAAGAKFEFVEYPGAVHSFTNPMADGSIPGVKYNEAADTKSWAKMQEFFNKLFKESQADQQGTR